MVAMNALLRLLAIPSVLLLALPPGWCHAGVIRLHAETESSAPCGCCHRTPANAATDSSSAPAGPSVRCCCPHEATRPEKWADKSLRETVAGQLEVMVRVYSEAGPLLRVFVAHAARSQQVWREGRRLRGQAIRRFIELGLRHDTEIGHPEPAKALELGMQMVFGVLQQKAILGDVRVQQRALGNPELVQEFTRMMLAYLQVRE